MPTAILEATCACDSCNQTFKRRDMSAISGICNRCLDRYYGHCCDCGRIILIDYNPAGFEPHHLPPAYNRGRHCPPNERRCYACWSASEQGFYRWDITPFDASIVTYDRIGSKRKFGVELETATCDGYELLRGDTFFGCKGDCTISGLEFPSPVLYGDEGLECIEDFLSFANNHDWSANGACGCHTHYDMRDESNKHLYRIAYAYAITYNMWRRCVPSRRRNDSYCKEPRSYNPRDLVTCSDRTDFYDFADGCERYEYVNLLAYCDHTTFENRLLEGTVDAETICNWITIHCRFMDRVKCMTFSRLAGMFECTYNEQFRALVDLINDTNLTDWLANRARYIGQAPLRGPRSRNTT